MEVWKNISGYEGYYQASNFGNIRRVGSKSNLVIKYKKSGYAFVCFSVNNKQKYFHVHRLVAASFIENPENKPCVNHKDMDKSNNIVENIEWVTILENNTHARKNKKFKNGSKKGIDNPITQQIAQYKNDELVYVWGCVSEASKQYDLVSSAILKAIQNCTVSLGFTWRKISKDEYLSLKNNFNSPPISEINKRTRDLSLAHKKRIENIANIKNEYLIQIGLECLIKNNRLIRKDYDILTKEKKGLTYVPTCKRFGNWDNFKKEVLNTLYGNNQLQNDNKKATF